MSGEKLPAVEVPITDYGAEYVRLRDAVRELMRFLPHTQWVKDSPAYRAWREVRDILKGK